MEYFERIEIENNIIINHIIGEKPNKEKEGITYIYGSNIQANIGDDVRMYEDLIRGKKKSLKTLRRCQKTCSSCWRRCQYR